MTYDFSNLTTAQQGLLTFGGWSPECNRPQPGPRTVKKLIERLEDERAANAMLIEENDRLQARLERAEAAVENLSEQAKAAHGAAHAIGMAAGTSVTDLPSAVRGMIEQNGEMRSEIEAARAELARQHDDSARQAALDLAALYAGDRQFREMPEDAMHARMWRVIRALPLAALYEIWLHVPADRMDDAMFIAARQESFEQYQQAWRAP